MRRVGIYRFANGVWMIAFGSGTGEEVKCNGVNFRIYLGYERGKGVKIRVWEA